MEKEKKWGGGRGNVHTKWRAEKKPFLVSYYGMHIDYLFLSNLATTGTRISSLTQGSCQVLSPEPISVLL